jgi:hypothetical protein
MKVVIFAGDPPKVFWSAELNRKQVEEVAKYVEEIKKKRVEHAE